MNELNEIDNSLSTLNENKFIDLILYGSDKFNEKKSHYSLMCKIHQRSQRFDKKPAIFF